GAGRRDRDRDPVRRGRVPRPAAVPRRRRRGHGRDRAHRPAGQHLPVRAGNRRGLASLGSRRERMTAERFLVTGALGCVGAWTVRALVREGTPVVGFDLGTNTRRLAQILEPDELADLTL